MISVSVAVVPGRGEDIYIEDTGDKSVRAAIVLAGKAIPNTAEWSITVDGEEVELQDTVVDGDIILIAKRQLKGAKS